MDGSIQKAYEGPFNRFLTSLIAANRYTRASGLNNSWKFAAIKLSSAFADCGHAAIVSPPH